MQESVSTTSMVYAMVGLAAFFCCFSYVQHRRYQSQMQSQVKNIIAEYMPLESDQNLNQNTSVSEEDGQFT
jgi:lipopolysaccharide export LptBFGC system permease protein LptF